MASPRLYLLSRPLLVDSEVKRLLDDLDTAWRATSDATDAEALVEFAGRICYLSFGQRQSNKSNPDYLAHLITQGHDSVLEHANWTFVLAGVSRAFTHQLVRHRIGFSFSQLSQQYHDESKSSFVRPARLDADPRAAETWDNAVLQARAAYRDILSFLSERPGQGHALTKEEQRAVRSAARSVLPAATETTIAFTANGRALRHFLEVRGAILGDEEMRLVAASLLGVLEAEAPSLVADFSLDELEDGSPIVRKLPLRRMEPPTGS